MSLLSPFSPFSQGEGVGSKALTHQQVPFSPFIRSLSSQLPLFHFSSLLSVPLSLHSIPPSLFSIATVCFLSFFGFSFHYFPFWPALPVSPVILCLPSLILCPCPLSSPCLFISHIPIVLPCLLLIDAFIITLSPFRLLPFHPPLPSFIRSF